MKLLGLLIGWLHAPLSVAPQFDLSHLLAAYEYDILIYLDDILFVSCMPYRCSVACISLLQRIFDLFGLTVHPTKSVFVPYMEIEYLGYTVNTAGQLHLTEHRRSKVRRAASVLLSGLVH